MDVRDVRDVLPVFVADWEMECCGEPFALDTQVRWTLAYFTEDEVSVPEEALLPADSRVAVAATRAGPAGRTGAVGHSRVSRRGALFATWHGDEGRAGAAAVSGTVRRIRLVRQRTVRADRVTTVLRDGARLTELAASRSVFTVGPGHGPEASWSETGLLVDLDVDLAEVAAAVSA